MERPSRSKRESDRPCKLGTSVSLWVTLTMKLLRGPLDGGIADRATSVNLFASYDELNLS